MVGARLRAAREAAGMSLDAVAARTSWSKAALGHFETGRRTPNADVISCYERLFKAAIDPVTAMSTLGRNDVDRRSFLRRAAYSAATSASALALPAEPVQRLIATDDTRLVGIGEVQALRHVIDAFARLDEHRGGGVGRTAVAELLATDVTDMLRARHASGSVRAQAFSAAAELAYLAGFKAHDAGHHGLAQRYYLTALELATESGIPGHDGWVFRILALQGADLGQRRFCVDLAEEAVRRVRGRVDTATEAVFTVALARCHAETGQHEQARTVLTAAEPGIHTDHVAAVPPWCAWWCGDKATAHNQTAKAFRALSEWREAEAHHLEAASFWDPSQHRRVWGRTIADVGVARWEYGDHSGALEAWASAVPILKTLQSTRADGALKRIRRRAPELV
ncbi:helix-turn-helix protein [Nocardia bhagyanarayanae]|uniref:Helix-turn-helix protein n=2 Tax=Nocardia bhagyanarayanae TaxID=1215925 RepID=A0A543FG21_9NOCA|nr:helix-turn-helix protein [Nocardia bhagyanarayanae]